MPSGKVLSPKTIREILSQRKLAPRKSLGQNFLTDNNILAKITEAGIIKPGDLVLEIGPGLGALTEVLLEQAEMVMAIEYDRGLFSILKEHFASSEKLRLFNQDIMETDLSQLVKDQESGLKVIANLPYYITTPIIFKLVEAGINWELMVFLVQKEVAERLCAKPGSKEYGSLTVMLNFYGKVEKIGNVSRKVFYPEPDVDSSIVRITPYRTLETQLLYPRLSRIVQAAFQQRRKTILNALSSNGYFQSKEEGEVLLKEHGIDPQRRGETLSVAEFISLTEGLVPEV
ncbi:MAG: 16S rRNA (adenine(1518)-N(6)/adenine(1519)-N(6))-dimethyltransferase RsmA [Firmicutes bacterium]|nr:16S rRNA (adenine(1518)-N(6)/adenine(1519)-N(6))-dimethyltransferase RsmA [Bacillota bacterium]